MDTFKNRHRLYMIYATLFQSVHVMIMLGVWFSGASYPSIQLADGIVVPRFIDLLIYPALAFIWAGKDELLFVPHNKEIDDYQKFGYGAAAIVGGFLGCVAFTIVGPVGLEGAKSEVSYPQVLLLASGISSAVLFVTVIFGSFARNEPEGTVLFANSSLYFAAGFMVTGGLILGLSVLAAMIVTSNLFLAFQNFLMAKIRDARAALVAQV